MTAKIEFQISQFHFVTNKNYKMKKKIKLLSILIILLINKSYSQNRIDTLNYLQDSILAQASFYLGKPLDSLLVKLRYPIGTCTAPNDLNLRSKGFAKYKRINLYLSYNTGLAIWFSNPVTVNIEQVWNSKINRNSFFLWDINKKNALGSGIINKIKLVK
jgi:hypothetical protein